MGGYSGASLATEVSKAGGIGFIGAGVNLRHVHSELTKARTLFGNRISNESASATVDAGGSTEPQDRQGRPSSENVLPIGIGFLCFALKVDDVVAILKQHQPAVIWLFSVHKVHDYVEWVEKLRQSTTARIWIQTGSVSESLELARTSAPDTLVLQGKDAGGHGALKGAGIISLLQEVADALAAEGFSQIPLVAAGGIVDHRGVAASLISGAAGLVLGTRFLASPEAILPHPYVGQAILAAKDGGQTTMRSTVFDDMNTKITWPAHFDGRALRNDTSKDLESGVPTEENRIRYTHALKAANRGYGSAENRASVWCGTGVGLVTTVMPAREIVETLRGEARQLLLDFPARL